ncbi:hypothetical protein LAZ40_05425 [Cereibacter sphaeroides]|uniref:hypothetical protein n=1 Tax=Cereibacter sphaeroides TaxID=1063 RepID=UPI001F45A682|nr:hypothetical protein [Cereibacter sphaeroides]MCE6958489.1 hypothetical protein [Cereibacter sphaeroides]MCE6972849.1 hypothetical protein [Cereibacter sphaeroides]
MTDGIRTRNTRTGDPRKIDEWSVKLPGGKKAAFDVSMIYEDGTAVFSVRSEHPDFKNCRFVNPDLNALREELDIHVREVIRRTISADWEPARKVEVSHRTRGREGEMWFDLELRIHDIEWMPGERVGNRGETVIRNEHRQEVVVQRAQTDDFSDMIPKSGSLTDPETMAIMRSPLWREPDAPMTRLVLPGRGAEATDMLAALERFGALLAARTAPAAVSLSGFPTPADLVELMREAAEPRDDTPAPGA